MKKQTIEKTDPSMRMRFETQIITQIIINNFDE